ncbi:WSSV080 [White spot syndrome virus]|uniref:WSSV080 n=1 Tax=White spot syndrome virus TaxID=92652 RepID=Q8QTG0_WSSV|nr:WSSV080 [Shrimp white spot syndrome virus]
MFFSDADSPKYNSWRIMESTSIVSLFTNSMSLSISLHTYLSSLILLESPVSAAGAVADTVAISPSDASSMELGGGAATDNMAVISWMILE